MRRKFIYAFLPGIALSLIFFILSFFLPSVLSSNYYERSLNQLRHTAMDIKREFSRVLDTIDNCQRLVTATPAPMTSEEIFSMFKRLNLNPEKEGISYCDGTGYLFLWFGNIIDLKSVESQDGKGVSFEKQTASLLIKDKASVYLVDIKQTPEGDYFVFYHLLAFLPRFKTPYLKEYHFLKPKLLRDCNIQYWDFREDVSTLEREPLQDMKMNI